MNKKTCFVPKEHLSRYDFLTYCQNTIIDILKYADKSKLSNVKIDFKETDFEEFKRISEQENKEFLCDWILQSEYKDIFLEYQKKHLFFSLLRDFYNYYSASLENIAKQNISVAWSLLRRPLQETLAYIEWLAVDGDELVNLMLESSEAKEYDISNRNRFGKKVERNITKLLGESFIDSSVINIYDFRYSKTSETSLNGILNGANHLVVDRSNSFKTSPSGLNFVFLDGQEFENGLWLYYTALPYVMFYSLNVITKIFAEIAKLNDYTKIMNSYNFILKNFKAMGSMSLKEALDFIDIDVPIICPRCGKKMKKEKYFQQFSYDKVRCPRCLYTVNTFSYIFDFEKIEVVSEDNKGQKSEEVK